MSCHLLDFVKNSSAIYPSPLLSQAEPKSLIFIRNRPEVEESASDEMMLEQSRNMTPVTGSTCAKHSFARNRRCESDTAQLPLVVHPL